MGISEESPPPPPVPGNFLSLDQTILSILHMLPQRVMAWSSLNCPLCWLWKHLLLIFTLYPCMLPPSHWLPGITSQIKSLHASSCSRHCFPERLAQERDMTHNYWIPSSLVSVRLGARTCHKYQNLWMLKSHSWPSLSTILPLRIQPTMDSVNRRMYMKFGIHGWLNLQVQNS